MTAHLCHCPECRRAAPTKLWGCRCAVPVRVRSTTGSSHTMGVPISTAHLCHWPGCRRAVPPKLWGCRSHWFSLPKRIRDLIWATYRPGQEVDKRPSAAYLEAAQEAERYARGKHDQV